MTRGEVLSADPAATDRIGHVLGAALRGGDLVALNGPLGAGKTCLVRGMVAGAGGDADAVRSPTFVLHQPHRASDLTLHHVDLYRLGARADIEFLDLDNLLDAGAVVIEWAELADLGLRSPATVEMAVGDGDRRVLRLLPGAAAHLVDAWGALLVAEPVE